MVMIQDSHIIYICKILCIQLSLKGVIPHVIFIIMRSYVNWDEETALITSIFCLSNRDDHVIVSSKNRKPFI